MGQTYIIPDDVELYDEMVEKIHIWQLHLQESMRNPFNDRSVYRDAKLLVHFGRVALKCLAVIDLPK